MVILLKPQSRVKRIFDFVFALMGLVVFSPLLVILGILIKTTSCGPIFFRQKRVGIGFTSFHIYKFRTMVRNAPLLTEHPITIGEDFRITRVGKLLRKLKIDELPQLVNVLKGEMSIVGPRPEIPRYVDYYKKDFEMILTVPPGITDMASLVYFNEAALLARASDPEEFYLNSILPEKIRLARNYVQDQCFSLDMKIIFKTFTSLFISLLPHFSIRKWRKKILKKPSLIFDRKLGTFNVSNLLGRELIQADFTGIERFITGKRVLITGGGGSIGSELSKFVLKNHPEDIILVDISENNLHEILNELARFPSQCKIHSYLSDITRSENIEEIFARHKPTIVYHAAANKHVPFVETHFREGIRNNILGTKVIADLSLRYGVECFVLISTDKAINPQSIMGASKRIAELYIQNIKAGETRFLTVRFGNVFNCKGNVISIFQKQIEEGHYVTITHPEVKRYFIDVSEAVLLILQATLLGSNSEIFVLDMGKSIKIENLARNLAQLMGVSVRDLSIQYIGLRPGEKLEEELELNGEQVIFTKNKKIKIWKPQNHLSNNINEKIDELIRLTHQDISKNTILQYLKHIVPEYTPWRSIIKAEEKF